MSSLPVLQAVAVARHLRQFPWRTASGVIYLIFLTTIWLAGAARLTRGFRDHAARSL